jgi:hypothetical protein
VAVVRPVSGSTTNNNEPAFSGRGGTAPGDSSAVTVNVFSGSTVSDLAVQTLTAAVLGGSWSVAPTQPLADGTYTALAEQSDRAGNTGLSAPSTFTISTTPPAPVNSPAGGSSTPSSYSIGGTVSGLSGTVVLQDNGGDDLTVSSDGSFTFVTPVASGAGFSVTVKNNPSGRTCSVSGAVGKVAAANVTSVQVTCTASPTGSTLGQDDFDRPNGSLGSGWQGMNDGGLSIVSQQAVGRAGAIAGDVRVAEAYSSDQYSQVEVSSTPLPVGAWVGPTVRSQSGGQNTYLGLYWHDQGSGDFVLQLYVRQSGSWTQLGSTYTLGGPLPAGTQLTLSAVGSTISLQEDGTQRIAVYDNTLTGGAPGLMTYGAATAAGWRADNAVATPPLEIQYQGTDATGVASYSFTSPDDGYGTQTLRVLAPTDPAPGVPHNFLFVLPVEPGLGTVFGDGLETLQSLDAQDKYNLTIVEPTFTDDPWYADSTTDPRLQYQTFITKDLVPWVTLNLSASGHEQNWLIGFSKSGIGGQDLLLKYPNIFSLAASWDFPADMATYDQYGSSAADEYGTDANFQANYRLTSTFLGSHRAPFLSSNRI